MYTKLSHARSLVIVSVLVSVGCGSDVDVDAERDPLQKSDRYLVNQGGNFSGTLGSGNSSTIPAVSLSQADGQHLVAAALGKSATVDSPSGAGSGYEAWSGTSMATPHVAGVAALVWSKDTSWTNQQIRDALERAAMDLGAAGRDDAYSHGLVQAKKALDFLLASGDGGGGGGGSCAPLNTACASDAECCSTKCRGRAGAKVCK
ncbi:MAG: S8 family serine peptidase [Deltaproteobacteria bacterium]|nr:S8 family serine peptidase [Deltaproteobacteria bacterium]